MASGPWTAVVGASVVGASIVVPVPVLGESSPVDVAVSVGLTGPRAPEGEDEGYVCRMKQCGHHDCPAARAHPEPQRRQ